MILAASLRVDAYCSDRSTLMRLILARMAVGLLFLAASGGAFAASITPDPWPREFTTPKGNKAVMYQPQIETFKGDTFTGRAAVSVTKKDDNTTKFGVIFFAASVSVDRDDRSVQILRLKVNRVRFPNITLEKEKTFAGIVEAEVPKWNLVISYDRALESVKVAEREKKSAEGLRNDPPRILFAREPTVLVTLDGEPQLRDVEGAPLKLVVNTPLFMVLDTRSNRYYVSGGKKWWYEAPDAKGPWRSIGGPPADIADLAAQAAEAQKKDDADAPADDGTEAANPPKIVVATEPTELIVSEGKPSFKPVSGASAELLSRADPGATCPPTRSPVPSRGSLPKRTSATCARACRARTRPRTRSSTPRSRRRRPSGAPRRSWTCSTTASRSSSRSKARRPSTPSTRRPRS